MKEEKPDSDYCYETRIFGEGKQCPDLNDAVTMEPKCKRFGKRLTWTVSGKVLKCDECEEDERA